MFDATLKDRKQSFDTAPGTTMFLHWLVGMVYVFYFASFILLLREVSGVINLLQLCAVMYTEASIITIKHQDAFVVASTKSPNFSCDFPTITSLLFCYMQSTFGGQCKMQLIVLVLIIQIKTILISSL